MRPSPCKADSKRNPKAFTCNSSKRGGGGGRRGGGGGNEIVEREVFIPPGALRQSPSLFPVDLNEIKSIESF